MLRSCFFLKNLGIWPRNGFGISSSGDEIGVLHSGGNSLDCHSSAGETRTQAANIRATVLGYMATKEGGEVILNGAK